MVLITPGYFPATFYPDWYWQDDYWPEYAVYPFLRGATSVSDILSSEGTTAKKGSLPTSQRLGSSPDITERSGSPTITKRGQASTWFK